MPFREALVLLLLPLPLLAQNTVRLVRVPETLVLPASAGSNLLLEAEVSGEAHRVFVGAHPCRSRLAMVQAAPGRFQANLGDAMVEKLVREAEGDALYVFVEDKHGGIVQSLPIAFRRAGLRAEGLTCTARLLQTAEPAAVPWAVTRWFDPAAVQQLDVDGAAADCVLLAQFGTTDCPLVRGDGRGRWRLLLDEQKRAAWQQAGRLELVVQRGSELQPAFALEAIPAALPRTPFSVVQRRSEIVPGSRGWLRVKIDDITRGQTLLEVRTADGRQLVTQRSVGDRDHVPLALPNGQYVLVVKRLVNLLIGDDFAELEVVPAAGFRADPIAQLLLCIAEAPAGIAFVREGRDYDGGEAAAHVRQKLSFVSGEVTVDQFIDQIASKSSATGSDYEVRLADGKLQPMREWLRGELRRLQAAPPHEGGR